MLGVAEEQAASECDARSQRYARDAGDKTLLPGGADHEESSMEQR